MSSTAMTTAALTITVVMLVTWVISLVVKNASIVDVAWGIGFVAVAWMVAARVDGNVDRQFLIVAMTTLWGVRLAVYLFIRNRGAGEDYRYRAMRKRWGSRFPLASLGTVFILQGVLMWIVSLPVQLGQVQESPDVGVLAWLGVALWAVGLFFEAVGDAQLAQFKEDPANEGLVMDRGLWKYTRHPNYFGEACVWWGFWLIACAAGGWWSIAGPALLTVLLWARGIRRLERHIGNRRPQYDDYVLKTNAFFPGLHQK